MNRAHRMPSHAIGLQNQTFRIQGEFYTLLARLGSGKFASVWKSTTENGDRVAVKVFDFKNSKNHISPAHRMNSFENEIKMANRMRDEINYAVTIYTYDFNPQKRLGLIVMELGDESLKNRVESLHQMHLRSATNDYDYISAQDRKNIWIQLFNIVLALHQHNVVHRDIKPDNLVFFGPMLKVVDFGIAQDEFARHHGHRQLGGTYPYSAPECFSGEAPITSKADIWSAGANLYYVTYGKAPFYGTPQPPIGIPQTSSTLVQDLLYRCFQKYPNRRANHHELAENPLTNSNAIF